MAKLPDRRFILRKLTRHKIERMKLLREKGYSSREIGRMFKVSGTTVLLHTSKAYKEKQRILTRIRRSYKYKTDPAWRKKYIARVVQSRKNVPPQYLAVINKRRRLHYEKQNA